MKPVTPKELKKLVPNKAGLAGLLAPLKPLLKPKGPACQCPCCRTSRKFYRITAKLKPTDREWMRGFYDCVLNEAAEHEMQEAWRAEQKRN